MEFLAETENKIKNLVNALGWDYGALSAKTDNFVNCPNTEDHRLPADRVENHLEKCCWIGRDYSSLGPSLSESADNVSGVTLTPELQERIIVESAHSSSSLARGSKKLRPVPRTSNQLLQAFNREERLALYEYAVANTEHRFRSLPDVLLNVPQKVEEKRELTELEKAAADRDAKRRRATYRNKVHTNRKTQTEIMKEVIESQMTAVYPDLEPTETAEEKPSIPKEQSGDHEGHSSRHRRYSENRSYSRRHDRREHNDSRRRYHDRRYGGSKEESRHRSDEGSRRHGNREDYGERRDEYDKRSGIYGEKRENINDKERKHGEKRDKYDKHGERKKEFGEKREEYNDGSGYYGESRNDSNNQMGGYSEERDRRESYEGKREGNVSGRETSYFAGGEIYDHSMIVGNNDSGECRAKKHKKKDKKKHKHKDKRKKKKKSRSSSSSSE